MENIEEGIRVRFLRDVERYPHFVVPKGCTGVVAAADDELVSVELDKPVEGSEEWNRHVHWYAGEHLEHLRDDLEVVE